jgi:hypothetical protein
MRLQEAIRRFTANENLRRDDHIAIIQKYHDEKTNLKIGNLTSPMAKEYFDNWGRDRLIADLVVMDGAVILAVENGLPGQNLAIVEAINSDTVDI